MLQNLLLGKLTLDAIPFHNSFAMGAGAFMVLGFVGVLTLLTVFKKWSYIWNEWVTSVDHKKIGIMYLILSFVMLLRGFSDALLMRAQQAVAAGDAVGFLPPDHYDQIFTAHGVIMIFFVAMPLVFALLNMIVPLQIGARDVAYPYLNSLSFWLTFVGAMLCNISLVVGQFASTGWLAYPPLSELYYSPDVGVDYYIWSLQISGVGSLLAGINFIATILKMRCKGMTLMKMPVFVWSALCAMILVALAFPVLTVTLALLSLDRMLDMHFFSDFAGGNSMMYINLIWVWGHPEVYILILPVFGIFSEVVATFSQKKLFGYTTMVWAIAMITLLSFLVWLHHFFTMGAGADVNSFFGIATMIIAIPTGVKVFNWLFTMYKGRIIMATPMLWVTAFFTTFAIGGMTGVMMAVPPVDFQTHNSLFLVAHFHNVIIGGVLFGAFAGITYWFPKAFGFRLDETWGKRAFYFWVSGFYCAFMPLYVLGLDGFVRRTNHYANTIYQPYLIFAAMGALLILTGIVFQVIQLIVSIKNRHALHDRTGDPWNGRTLEWSVASPAPVYNFAKLPTVQALDQFWVDKEHHRAEGQIHPKEIHYEPIHMPKNTSVGFIIAIFSGITGFALIWHMLIPGIIGLLGVVSTAIARTFSNDVDYYIDAETVKRTELAHFRSLCNA
ncbi:TPA: cytochrome o ubiquinol oxidase subunit I [Legionella pneumophila subsp. pneumophila]|uniref:cytochrome o ubiquinol oxidase subunit I n=1 Tax=Legionella sp. PATHC039 TaxID=2992042 RepID=UPI001A1D9111|nr:cytochrome o ubiquinol oxidase subunit I [Legionella sp. PATHC039]MCW8394413.1 cytochrome o ubiquinol oxidase subunit I [Legionella sp. PATHC039]HAT8860299.1 cytochrome o ubiquinol oxidase subunit I [Legionella pneumophila subsp. pneumophila]HAT9652097.1 cytochrome o ubiquinol oxidase subunit I [Legionella pneumophila subsp. pneumophila]HAT9921460.1 cytochrome o ubiquinol oxidase subunit I [Legionella pneumophila subsp. pneumophila]